MSIFLLNTQQHRYNIPLKILVLGMLVEIHIFGNEQGKPTCVPYLASLKGKIQWIIIVLLNSDNLPVRKSKTMLTQMQTCWNILQKNNIQNTRKASHEWNFLFLH